MPTRVSRGGVDTIAISVPISAENTTVAHERRYAIIEIDYRDFGDDEISSIVRGIDELVKQVRRRATEREGLNERLSAEIATCSLREEELAKALADQHVLLRETHHRVKNNMQVILSLVGLQASNAVDENVSRALELTRARLYALSLVMDRLYSRVDVEHLPRVRYRPHKDNGGRRRRDRIQPYDLRRRSRRGLV